jgi:hypothetical protein
LLSFGNHGNIMDARAAAQLHGQLALLSGLAVHAGYLDSSFKSIKLETDRIGLKSQLFMSSHQRRSQKKLRGKTV